MTEQFDTTGKPPPQNQSPASAIRYATYEDACKEITRLRAALTQILDHGWITVENFDSGKPYKSTRDRLLEIERIAREALK